MGIKDYIQEHSGTACAIGAVAGVFVTAWLSGKAAVNVYKETEKNPFMTRKEKAKLYCKSYWKAAVGALTTTGFIVGSDRIHVGKEAVLATGAAVWKEKAMDLDNKIKEEFGEEKSNELKKKIIEDKVKEGKPETGRDIYCYDPYTDQFFWSSRERLTYAMYKANEMLVKECSVTLNFVNLILGAKWTKEGEELSWSYDNVIQEDGWAWTGGCWIELIPDVKEIKGKTAFVIFYQVDPMKQLPEDMIYSEYGGT